ncbi:Phage protein [Vibrio cholerae]|nr:Phage protein [Vibrio cholerae]
MVNVPILPYSVLPGTDLSKAFEHTVKSLNNQNEFVRREVESLKIQSQNQLQGLYNLFRENTDAVKSSQQHITDTRNESVKQTQEFYKANDKLQQLIIKSADMLTSMATTRSIINSNADNIVRAVRDVQQTISPLEFGLFDINENTRLVNQNLAALSEGLFLTMQENTDKIVSAINANGGVSGNGDLSGVQSGIDSVKSGIDNLNGLLSGEGLSKPGISSGVNFGEMPLYGSDSLAALNTEITDLQKEYSEKIKDFQKLFSFDVSKLNTGEYKEHSLSFRFANGQETSIKSSVFPALVANAGLISSVILFLAALAGLRIVMGGGDK